ncbi:MAG: hypothetical protein MJZ37_08905, partial [Bacilli bacterium]|nr:hypothetical protein [Bacilli bacterium]
MTETKNPSKAAVRNHLSLILYIVIYIIVSLVEKSRARAGVIYFYLCYFLLINVSQYMHPMYPHIIYIYFIALPKTAYFSPFKPRYGTIPH